MYLYSKTNSPLYFIVVILKLHVSLYTAYYNIIIHANFLTLSVLSTFICCADGYITRDIELMLIQRCLIMIKTNNCLFDELRRNVINNLYFYTQTTALNKLSTNLM